LWLSATSVTVRVDQLVVRVLFSGVAGDLINHVHFLTWFRLERNSTLIHTIFAVPATVLHLDGINNGRSCILDASPVIIAPEGRVHLGVLRDYFLLSTNRAVAVVIPVHGWLVGWCRDLRWILTSAVGVLLATLLFFLPLSF
jgi:hypothetical protein